MCTQETRVHMAYLTRLQNSIKTSNWIYEDSIWTLKGKTTVNNIFPDVIDKATIAAPHILKIEETSLVVITDDSMHPTINYKRFEAP